MDYKERLKKSIKEQGYNYTTFGAMINLSENTIRTTLNNAKSMQIDTIKRYADALNIPLNSLFSEPGGEQTETICYAPTAICPHCGKPVQIKLE